MGWSSQCQTRDILGEMHFINTVSGILLRKAKKQ